MSNLKSRPLDNKDVVERNSKMTNPLLFNEHEESLEVKLNLDSSEIIEN